MKRFAVVLLLILAGAVASAQSYIEQNKAPYARTKYGATYFKGDSNFVSDRSGYFTVTVSVDTTAGTGVWWCANDDSTNAIHLLPGTGGSYGDARTFKVKGLHHYRVKGAYPTQTAAE